MTDSHNTLSPTLSDLPDDELIEYGRDLGLDLADGVARGELLRLIRRRQELLLELDRQAMLDVVIWARRPVRRSASKEALARHIAQLQLGNLAGLSDAGLEALARLRGLEVLPGDERADLERRLRHQGGLGNRLRRARRKLMARIIARAVSTAGDSEYRFLPDEEGDSLRDQIQTDGVVGGIARKLRGVADDYVREKLDEIEQRIDRKLDEIDQRLGEWRDREISNRLRILKMTLIVSVLVALISLGYDWLGRAERSTQTPADSRTISRLEQPRDTAGENSPALRQPDVREVQPPGR
ncbi:MAG: hypothetical protein ACE5GE_11000 [Phycisphaerae bacterium]